VIAAPKPLAQGLYSLAAAVISAWEPRSDAFGDSLVDFFWRELPQFARHVDFIDGLSGLGDPPNFELRAIFESRNPGLGSTQDVSFSVNHHV
jgi:hypothetical protein